MRVVSGQGLLESVYSAVNIPRCVYGAGNTPYIVEIFKALVRRDA